jgi:hypothetical protein
MKNLIKKILKESEDDFDWTRENNTEVSIEEISDWVDGTRNKIQSFIKQINEFYAQSPQMKWDGNEVEDEDEDIMVALSVKSIGDELRNIFSSLDSISDEIQYIKNPELFRDND